jgi:hypothetical protein
MIDFLKTTYFRQIGHFLQLKAQLEHKEFWQSGHCIGPMINKLHI